jgi:glycerate 2-kinase
MTLVSDALAIARAGVRAVDPGAGVRRNLRRTARGYEVGGRPLHPGPHGRLAVVAIGKAASAMADAAAAVARGRIVGLVVTPRGYPSPRSSLEVVRGEHPVPGTGSFRAGRSLLRFVHDLDPEDAALFLISGGGSAVAEVPSPGLTEGDLRHTTEILLASGAPIGAMNAVRRHTSRLKGGQLALAARAGRFATLALSDVVGDRPADIASGPTVGDPSTFRDAFGVAHRYRFTSRLPSRVLGHLRRGARGLLAETPKPSVRRLRGAPFTLVASNRLALRAAADEASARGYVPHILSSRVTGETQPAARAFARAVLSRVARSRGDRVAVLSGGETTVTLGPHPGRGGRNLEFALASAEVIRGAGVVALSLGTDGIDGPTEVAGGWADGVSFDRARRAGVDPRAALRRHASYDAVASWGGLVRTGPTGTNVMDLHLGLGAAREAAGAGVTPSARSGGPTGRSGTAGSSRPGGAPSNRRTPS